jgi:hypothetical protein
MADFLGQLGDILAQVAPTAASMFGGPLAGTAVTWVEGQLGITPPAGSGLADRQQTLLGALQGLTGDQLVAVRKADSDWKVALVNAGVLLEQTDEKDRESARSMAAAMKDRTPMIIAILVIAMWCGVEAFLMFGTLTTTMQASFETGQRTLQDVLMLVVSYYFGSSAGHQRATELLAQSSPAS